LFWQRNRNLSNRKAVAMRTQPPWRLSLQAWVGLLALGLVFWLIVVHAELILEMIWVLFGALLLSLAIRPLADTLTRWRIPRWLTVLGVYVGLVAALALLGNLLAPIVSAEVTRLQIYGPNLLKQALSQVATAPLLGRLLPSSDLLAQNLAQRADSLLRTFVSAVTGLGEFTLDLFVVLILTYFFATDVRLGEGLLRRWMPPYYGSRARLLMARLRYRLSRWVWARLAVAVYFGVVSSIGLTWLGVPFALTIGLVGGVLEIVPYLGSTVALVLAMVSALTVRPLLGLWVALFCAVVIEVKGHVLEPAFYGHATGLHPGAVLIVLLVGVKAGGVIGVLFAVPVVVVLGALLEEIQAVLMEPEAEARKQPSEEEHDQ
jgi:predicted PurR-regulated permease PerM